MSLLFEMKSRFLRQIIRKSTFRLILLAIVCTSGQCFPRQGEGTRSEFRRKSNQLVQNYDDYEGGLLSPKGNNGRLQSHSDPENKVKSIRHHHLDIHIQSGDQVMNEEAEGPKAKADNDDGLDKRARNHRHEGRHVSDKYLPEEDIVPNEEDDARMDLILNDIKPQPQPDSEPIIDYFYVTNLGDPAHQITRHGVIINLRGLIPSLDDEEDVDVIHQDVIAFKAFEVSSTLSGTVPGRSEYDTHTPAERTSLDTKVHSTLSQEPRNLSRKRRQKSTPSQEEEDRLRREFIRRKRRKRKKRLRQLAKDQNTDNDPPIRAHKAHDSAKEHRNLLRSNSPAYVIASAREVKRDWCKTVPLEQKITEPKCQPRIIENNFCYGQCNSFFIPHTGRSGNGGAFQSCAFCKPQSSRWVTVTLQCPGQNPPTVEKTVLMVDSCKCKTEVLS